MAIPSIMLRPPLLRPRILRSPSLPRPRFISYAPIIHIQNGTFYQNYPSPDDEAKNQNRPLFSDLNFELLPRPHRGKDSHGKRVPEQLAIIGSANRTQLLEILRGQHVCLPPTARSYPFLLSDEVAEKDPRQRFVGNAIEYVGFSGEGSSAIGGTRGAYLSARYESLREETDWTVRQYLKGQTSLNPLEGQEEGTLQDVKLFDEVVKDLRLHALLDMPVANLSNGQTRRARIAKALLKQPVLLLLDDPFSGLDPATRRSISALLQSLTTKGGPRMVLALRPQDPIPDWVTNVMILGNKNKVIAECNRLRLPYVYEGWVEATKTTPTLTKYNTPSYEQALEYFKSGDLDRSLMFDLRVVTPKEAATVQDGVSSGEVLVEMEGVRVQYGEKVVLGAWKQRVGSEKKEGLHWRVRRGQRWAVLGANGSGKTTLLSLITSDHPQAYALPIQLFGRSRLPEPGKPAISLFELQSRIGHSSPEIHAFFPRQLTLRQSLESAFAETFLGKPDLNHELDADISAFLRHFKPDLDPDAAVTTAEPASDVVIDRRFFPKLEHRRVPKPYYPDDYESDYADTVTFGQLNTVQQRLIIFLRALVSRPDIVILDEPFSGMSATLRDRCIHFLEAGEHGRGRISTALRRTATKDLWVKGYNPHKRKIRFEGLTDQQALIMISHNREEIPDIVRHYLRLPSESEDGEQEIDFRIGLIKRQDAMREPEVWDSLWSPPIVFESKSRYMWRRDRDKENFQDEDLYHYRTV